MTCGYAYGSGRSTEGEFQLFLASWLDLDDNDDDDNDEYDHGNCEANPTLLAGGACGHDGFFCVTETAIAFR